MNAVESACESPFFGHVPVFTEFSRQFPGFVFEYNDDGDETIVHVWATDKKIPNETATLLYGAVSAVNGVDLDLKECWLESDVSRTPTGCPQDSFGFACVLLDKTSFRHERMIKSLFEELERLLDVESTEGAGK